MTSTPAPGEARSPGLSYQQLLDTDSHPVPDVLRIEAPRFLGDEDVPVERYTSREWHEKEKRYLWDRVWQFACRESQVAEPGQHVVYDICDRSYLIMRGEDGKLRAFVNACLHRGRRLKQYDGHCSEVRCAFHGFAWKLNGDLQDVPAQWDFPHVQEEEWHLPEAQVDTWAGFVFLNPDPSAEPLSEFVGEMADQFERWDLERRFVQVHVAKLNRCNWKVAQEAFCEAFHVNATHPEVSAYLGDTNSQIDVWDTFSRVITPSLTPSPLLDWEPSEEDMARAMLDLRVDEPFPIQIPEGRTAREVMGAATRDHWRSVVGDRVDEWSVAEYLDSLDYTLFPNFHPWGAYNRIVYRFRPNGDDHRTSIMEVLWLAPWGDGERPPDADIHWLDFPDRWSTVEEFGILGKVFDQDFFNMEQVQRGLETTRKAGVTLGNYQEAKVRWLHQMLGEWIERGEKEERGD